MVVNKIGKIKQRQRKTLTGKPIVERQRIVKRAIERGIRNIDYLHEVSGLSKDKIKSIEKRARIDSWINRNMPLPRNAIERLLMAGELTGPEIAKRVGVSKQEVYDCKNFLAKRDINIRIFRSSNLAPMSICRTLLRLKVYRQLTAKKPWSNRKYYVHSGASDGVAYRTIRNWFINYPAVEKLARKSFNGRFWERAEKQLDWWIKEKETEFGIKYDPNK